MKAKSLILVVGVLLLSGFVGSAFAETDPIGDRLVAGYDIAEADVVVHPVVAGEIPELVTVWLNMAATNLPGIVIIEFDVDGDSLTGGSSGMPSIFKACATGTLIKPKTPGFDVAISLILRDQGPLTSTAWCYQCKGLGGNCFTKTEPCPGECGTSDCYRALASCTPAEPNCYYASERCTPPGQPQCDSCYELTSPCSDENECGVGRIIGEWYATTSSGGTGLGKPADRGRIVMPLPKGTNQVGEDVYTFPYKQIVEAVKADGGNFDLEKAKNPSTYLKWQISVWLDPNFAVSKGDLMNVTEFCNQVVDVIPNSGKLLGKASLIDSVLRELWRLYWKMRFLGKGSNLVFTDCQAKTTQLACETAKCIWVNNKCQCALCIGDVNYDAKVSTPDYSVIKWEFGRPGCPQLNDSQR